MSKERAIFVQNTVLKVCLLTSFSLINVWLNPDSVMVFPMSVKTTSIPIRPNILGVRKRANMNVQMSWMPIVLKRSIAFQNDPLAIC